MRLTKQTIKKKDKPQKAIKKKLKKPTQLIEFRPLSSDQNQGISQTNTGDNEKAGGHRRPKKGEKNYYENFDFFFKRTGFRTMTLFYKVAFKPIFDKWRSITAKQKVELVQVLIDYTRYEFPGLLEKMPPKAQFEFIELLKVLVLQHRHNKNDDFLADSLLDFSVVRDPCYKYSKPVQDRFFARSTYAFLFAWFAKSAKGSGFAL